MTFDELVDRLRVLFVQYRRRKQPFYRDSSKQLEEYLPKIAKTCIDCQATPDRFMAALYWKFCAQSTERDRFFPPALSGQAAKLAYAAYDKEFAPISLDTLWQSQWASLKNSIDRTSRTVEDTLLDDAFPLEPWFRIVCTKEEIPEVSAKYRAAAKAAMNPMLRQFLEKVAKEQLRRIR